MQDLESKSPRSAIRLNGWKEIANHLGKGVRTVQRWERQYGLPIHRIGEGQGEIVFAFAHEIARWTEEQERRRIGEAPDDLRLRSGVGEPPEEGNPHVAPAATAPPYADPGVHEKSALATTLPIRTRRARAIWYLLLPAALVVVALLGWLAQPGALAAPGGQPASWKVADQSLLVFDEEDRLLWQHLFEAPVYEREYAIPVPNWSWPVAVTDLDGDGTREVIVATRSADRQLRAKLRCFNADGTLRWVRQLDDRQIFGGDEYGPPWSADRFLVTRDANGQGTVWAVFTHGLLFPTVLEQIDARGRVVSRYWSNGYIEWVGESTWKGRSVLLVGAVNNEHKGASLVVLDRASASGTGPAVNPAYRCTTCDPGDPLAFVVFPPSPVGGVRGEGTAVSDAWVREEGFVVTVREPLPVLGREGHLVYTLDQLLRPQTVGVSLSYQQIHDALFESGHLQRRFGPEEERKLLRVLLWDSQRFVEQDPVERP